ncbi:MAG: SsrA-binding protein SmpB [Oscillospiraceae bacterium]|nr:SsrA-binding protein SmpB [Oscillospiraceae bacterium]
MIMVNTKLIGRNKKVSHDYFIEEKIEVGIELLGTEVKSLRAGKLNLKDSWCNINNGEIYVLGMHISPYEKGNIFNKDPVRVRRLLMHKKQISDIYGLMKREGYTVIPVSAYFKGSKVKLSIGICKGKKLHDKRQAIAEKDAKRSIQRELKERNRY